MSGNRALRRTRLAPTMAGYLTPDDVAFALKKNLSTLRRWRKKKTEGPPWVMHGGKPRYRADLIQPGDYGSLSGLQDRFPPPKVRIIDASGMSEEDSELLVGLMEKATTKEITGFEPGDSFEIVTTFDTTNPEIAAVLTELAKKVRQAVQGD